MCIETMKYPTEHDVKKVGIFIRCLSAFIFICSLIATLGVVFAVITEPFEPLILIGFLVVSLMLHVSGMVTFKGYAPKYLLFAHAPK